MYSKELLLLACLGMLGGLRLTSTTTTTTFVAAMSIGNQDLERYFHATNVTQTLAAEDRIAMDLYTYAFLNYTYMEGMVVHDINFSEEKARYGEGKTMSVKGKLVHISSAENRQDDTACTPNILGTGGLNTPMIGISWIALVRRGGCTFEEKVKNVYAKGAIGVIIYNDKSVLSLEKMQIKGKNRNITAVITYQEIGLEMAKIVDSGIDMTAAIIEGRSGMRPINTINRTSVLFVSISFILLMVISLVWLIFYYIQRFRYLHSKDQQSRHLCSVTKKAIMKIPTKTGKSTDEKDMDSDCCAICIEAYKPADCIRVLPCKHEFHKNCIDPWLIEHRTCPMCKLDVLKFYGYVFLGSEESILEYEAERTAGAASNATATDATNIQRTQVSNLIRSRDFVIDFPRIFVLDAGGATGTRDTLFPPRLPERSQSSMSLANAKDWVSQVTNKLDEQHGLRYLRKNSGMQEQLLDMRSDSIKRRRSRSADGRFSNAHLERTRQQLEQQQQQVNNDIPNTDTATTEAACSSQLTTRAQRSERRSSSILRELTDASYGRSSQRQREAFSLINERRRHAAPARLGADVIPLSELPRRTINSTVTSDRAQLASNAYETRESSPPNDTVITIQVNGEGVDLE